MHWGDSSSGAGSYVIGQVGGTENVTLTTAQMPQHSHAVTASSAEGNLPGPSNAAWAASPLNNYSPAGPSVNGSSTATTIAGSSLPHENMAPFQAITFIIALYGIFPSRN
jgi:microcystin-dependent protein